MIFYHATLAAAHITKTTFDGGWFSGFGAETDKKLNQRKMLDKSDYEENIIVAFWCMHLDAFCIK